MICRRIKAMENHSYWKILFMIKEDLTLFSFWVCSTIFTKIHKSVWMMMSTIIASGGYSLFFFKEIHLTFKSLIRCRTSKIIQLFFRNNTFFRMLKIKNKLSNLFLKTQFWFWEDKLILMFQMNYVFHKV